MSIEEKGGNARTYGALKVLIKFRYLLFYRYHPNACNTNRKS